MGENGRIKHGVVEGDRIYIRGVSHYLEHIRELEQRLGATIVMDLKTINTLDEIFEDYVKRNGEPPTSIVDNMTHDVFLPVMANREGGVLPLSTKLYFRVNKNVVVPGGKA